MNKDTFLTYEIQEQNVQYTIGDLDRPGRVVPQVVSVYEGAPGPRGKNGLDGKDGKNGKSATIEVGTTTTGQPGTDASVQNVGTPSAAIFNITIPRGADGNDYVLTAQDKSDIATIVYGMLNDLSQESF